MGILAFPDEAAVEAYYASPAYQSFSIMREAAGDTEVNMLRSFPPTEKEMDLNGFLFRPRAE